jgi:hypothetical protein
VIHAVQYLADQAVRIRKEPISPLHAMLYYIRVSSGATTQRRPRTVRAYQATHPRGDAVLDIPDEHERGEKMLDALVMALNKWEAGIRDG